MVKKIWKYLQVTLLTILLSISSLSVLPVAALDEVKDDTDLSQLELYQFTLTQENMEIVSQSASVVKDIVDPNGSWKQATVFSLKVDKNNTAETFDAPLKLKFSNAGTLYGKNVDVFVTVNKVNTTLLTRNSEYNDPNKTVLPFLTVDENWGTKSIQIMDYIYPTHPNITHNLEGAYAFDADVTTEFKYQDGTPCDIKMVMLPSDIDVVKGSRKETFSIYDMNNSVDKIVMNNANYLTRTTNGDKTTWEPSDGRGTSGDAEYNASGFAVRSTDNKMHFEYTTTAICGGLFGFFAEAKAPEPTKQVDKAEVPAKIGEELIYTTEYTIPTAGKNIIGSFSKMSMTDEFDERLDFQSATVKLAGQTLTENDDYTVEKNGQKVTVHIDKKHLGKSNSGKKFEIVFKVKTNEKIVDNGTVIKNKVTQIVDNVITPSNEVETKVLYNKTHEYISGTPGKELPTEVKVLLPDDVHNIPNGTTVTPDTPKGNVTKVSVPEGNWVFRGYDKQQETINNKDAHFIGVWVIEPYESPVKDVAFAADPTTSIDNKPVKPGDELEYSIKFKNITTSQRDVTMTDIIPENTTYVEGSASPTGTYDAVTRTLTLEKTGLAADAEVVFRFKVKVNEDANSVVIENTATVKSGDNTFTTNTTKNPTPTPPLKDVHEEGKLDTSINNRPVSAGQILTYTISYRNTAGEKRTVIVSDTIPAHTQYIDGTANEAGVYNPTTKTLQWQKVDLEAGDVVTFQFNVKVDADVDGEVIENHADVDDGINRYVTNTTKNPTPKKVTPKTSDTMNVWLYACVLLSTLVVGMIVLQKRFLMHFNSGKK